MNISKAAAYLSEADPFLQPVIARFGVVELPSARTNFHALLRSIISQQLSVKAAATIYGRVMLVLNNEITPKSLLKAEPQDLRQAGLSFNKINYARSLAEAFAQNPSTYERLHELSDDEVVELLTQIKGIGRWSAEMFLMFTLLREDVFPIDDLGIRNAMERLFFEGEKTGRQLLVQRAELWRPYRTVACFYLWRSLDNKG